MLLPDQTYDEHEPVSNIKSKKNPKKLFDKLLVASTPLSTSSSNDEGSQQDKSNSPGSYERTAEFFNNIPDTATDETFRVFFRCKRQRSDDTDEFSQCASEGVSSATSSDVLRECENFLWKNRMRTDFFCQFQKAVSSKNSSPKHKTSIAEETIKKTAKNPNDFETAPIKRVNANFNAIYTLPHRRKSTVLSPCAAADASSSNEAVHLQQRLKSLSTELVTLRNSLHVGHSPVANNNNNNYNNGTTAISTTAAASKTIPPSIAKQQQSDVAGIRGNNGSGPLASGLKLNASSPNLTLNTTNNNFNGVTTTLTTSTTATTSPIKNTHNNNNNNNNSSSGILATAQAMTLINNAHKQNHLQHQHQHQQHQPGQQQQQLQQQQQNSYNVMLPSINNHANNNNNNNLNNTHNNHTQSYTNAKNNHHNNNNNNNNTVNNNNNNNSNKHACTFSQTLPHNTSSSGIVSSRNTSIPHPLPHQIIDKTNGKTTFDETSELTGSKVIQPYNANTLPLRSSNTNQNFQNEFGRHSLKLVMNPCHGISTLSFGLAYQQIANNKSNFNKNISAIKGSQLSKYEDLINLPGPLTEDAVMRTLQARFKENSYFTNVGPILLAINPYLDVGNPLTLSSTRALSLAPQLRKIVQEAVRQQAETGYPQAIILSGTSGAGKTHCSMLLLRQLFAVAGGGPETDAFKHLAAAFTVLRSLGSAKTTTNSESSRIGQFIEVQVTDGALYRTKIHCYFLDQTRVIRPLPREKNYHIFYQMLVGLSREERIKLNLEGYSSANLRYLQSGDLSQNEQDDAVRFQEWKTCLGILGIPFLDVVRVLAAVLLLGNVQFIDGQGLEVDVNGAAELNSVASLLGVPPAALFRGLTTRTHNARGQLVKSVCDANMSNMTRDCLAKSLYCRTVATIVRRANSLKRLGSTLGTLSSDSNESVHNQLDVASQHASTIGGNSGSKSMAALNNAVRHATDGFIGILDMFGFEEPSPHAQLEHLCINLCAETMQHFYNTHIFKSSVESCRDEGIICDTMDYVDNVPCIDLISSLRTGLLSMLDAECSVRGTAESYVAKIKVQHRTSPRLEAKSTAEPHDPRMFVIRHFAGRVEYDATEFLDTNRDVVPDDLVAVFYKHSCNFGFATHLFGSELKALYALQSVPRGLSFRISPTSHTDLLNGDEPVSTLTQDFHTRLDNLLRTLVHARPHFVRCIRSANSEIPANFDRSTVVKQIRSLQVLETVNLMASGFPHRMRFKQFNARYRMLAPFQLLRRVEEKAMDDCNLILQYAMENPPTVEGSVTLAWAPGKRHVFLAEGIRQHLEHLRAEIRNKSATRIQATWRGWQWRKKMNMGKHRRSDIITMPTNKLLKVANTLTSEGPHISNKASELSKVLRPRPQPIAGTPPPDPQEKCDAKLIQQTCTLFGLDLERPPPVPPSRSYTIIGKSKLGYPQSRVMKINFPEDTLPSPTAYAEQLKKGETVNVVGASSCRGHLLVEHKGQKFHVPFQYMELKMRTCPNGKDTTTTITTTTSTATTSATTITTTGKNPANISNPNANITNSNNNNINTSSTTAATTTTNTRPAVNI